MCFVFLSLIVCKRVGELNIVVMLKCLIGLRILLGLIVVGLVVFILGRMVVMFRVGLKRVKSGNVGRLIFLGLMLKSL